MHYHTRETQCSTVIQKYFLRACTDLGPARPAENPALCLPLAVSMKHGISGDAEMAFFLTCQSFYLYSLLGGSTA